MVNGVEVNLFPMPTVNHVVAVKAGVNTFNVVAMDANYNVTETTVTITSAVFTPVVVTDAVFKDGRSIDRKSVV